MASKEEVIEALREVTDPELGLSVVELGLIREVDLESDPPRVKMVLTTPFCPFAPSMVQQVKDTAGHVAGKEVEVEVLDEAWSPSMMEDPEVLGFSS
jgi:metal-sulfur cluster biosynthetic enzyme